MTTAVSQGITDWMPDAIWNSRNTVTRTRRHRPAAPCSSCARTAATLQVRFGDGASATVCTDCAPDGVAS